MSEQKPAKRTLTESAIAIEGARREARRFWDAKEAPAHEPLHAFSVEELFARPVPDYVIDQVIPQGGLPLTPAWSIECTGSLLLSMCGGGPIRMRPRR